MTDKDDFRMEQAKIWRAAVILLSRGPVEACFELSRACHNQARDTLGIKQRDDDERTKWQRCAALLAELGDRLRTDGWR